MNPDYEIVLWDRSKFDVESTLWTKQAFDKKKYAFVADYIRFYALYHYGGIYLDSDIECIKPFDDLLDRQYFLGREWKNKDYIEAACIGAEPGLDWIKDCLDYYKDRAFIKPDGTMEDTTLTPIMGERLKKNYPEVMKAMLPNDYFTARDKYTGAVIATERTYTIHHMAQSWINDEIKYYYKIRSKILRYLPGHVSSIIADYISQVKYRGWWISTKNLINGCIVYIKKHI